MLAGQAVFAFCGLANPQKFFASLQAAGAVLAGRVLFQQLGDAPDRRQRAFQFVGECVELFLAGVVGVWLGGRRSLASQLVHYLQFFFQYFFAKLIFFEFGF